MSGPHRAERISLSDTPTVVTDPEIMLGLLCGKLLPLLSRCTVRPVDFARIGGLPTNRAFLCSVGGRRPDISVRSRRSLYSFYLPLIFLH